VKSDKGYYLPYPRRNDVRDAIVSLALGFIFNLLTSTTLRDLNFDMLAAASSSKQQQAASSSKQ